MAKSGELNEVLKPFYDRASDAEERLSRLEATIAKKNDDSIFGNEKLSSTVEELNSKLENAVAELVSERKKFQMLTTENEKLKYRIAHLVQALDLADSEIRNLRGGIMTRTA